VTRVTHIPSGEQTRHAPRTGASVATLLCAVVLLLTGCQAAGPGGGTSGGAACEAPTITATPETIAAGEAVTLTGRAFAVCNDAMDGDQPAPTPEGLPPAPVLWRQGDVEREVGTAVPDSDGAFVVDLVVPADAAPGPAELTVDLYTAPVTVQ